MPLQVARAFWLQRSCGRVCKVFNLTLKRSGSFPSTGLLVSNHLSYLDILVFGSLMPCIFVAKQDVRNWPIFGWFARLAGTVFVNRRKRTEVTRSAADLRRRLEAGGLVVLFPEGTSSGGETVFPFKSALLEVATCRPYPLSSAYIHYSLVDGSVADEVCYWREMTLVPHLFNLLGKRGVSAFVAFGPPHEKCADRKVLALRLHSEVLSLKATVRYDLGSSPRR
jgi:1-acyl-sn-glycerol-3-phosphate acyltransferase